MNLKDALVILENQELTVKVVGRGRVYEQSLEEGSKIKRDQQIIIRLKP
jgi:hypothetical protein